MQLLIDIGNSRVKWSFVKGDCLTPSRVMAHNEWLLSLQSLSWLNEESAKISMVVIASVANETLVKAVLEYTEQKWNCETRQLKTTLTWMQLKNGYNSPSQMGVDRWLAMIAAWDTVKKACMIFDCGTAITVDGIDERGQHLGGHIVPGLDMLQHVFIQETADVRPKVVQNQLKTGFAADTTGAVSQGNLCMMTDYLDSSWSRFQKIHPDATLFLTGGNGQLISELMGKSSDFSKDLVLQGLHLVVKSDTVSI